MPGQEVETTLLLRHHGSSCEHARPLPTTQGASDDQILPPNEKLNVPKYVKTFNDDTFYQEYLQKKDVVVVYAREQHCPDCDHYAKAFYKATRQLAELEDVAVGEIDAHEEMDLLNEWGGNEESLPALFVFKCSDTVNYKKKPTQFLLNSRMEDDFAPFVKRLRGPNARDLRSAKDLEDMITYGKNCSDNVIFTLWTPPEASDPAAKVGVGLFKRLAEIERFNSLYGMVDVKEFNTLAPKYNAVWKRAKKIEADAEAAGTQDELIEEDYRARKNRKPSEAVYIVSYDAAYTPPRQNYFKIPGKGDFKKVTKAALQWIAVEKTKRPGHKYDLANTFVADDIHVPSNCTDEHRLDNVTKKYVKVYVQMKTAMVGMVFSVREIEIVTLSNSTMNAIEWGLVGMCQGGNRTLVVPPGEPRKGWPHAESTLDELPDSMRLLIDIHVRYVGETNEMPGRIEWETDPEKIEEHRRKSEEQDRLRDEAIARGEDPDAHCKMPDEADEAPPAADAKKGGEDEVPAAAAGIPAAKADKAAEEEVPQKEKKKAKKKKGKKKKD
eukprot:TRINITY_DN774_c2_g1_i1.p1 TRINITY_DN774_c2_g1~~TRINITY_DN774_c2_g1_i1.p1  ORF type:complete len:552 (+),score=261.03 TRINITY_DN774_c2_g1_i1:158-1813(+)